MPGKHAPPTSRSFYLSVARAAGTVLAVLGVVIVIVIVAVDSDDEPAAKPTGTATARATATGTATAPPSEDGLRTRDETTVLVLNSTQRAGLAKSVSADLTGLGYRVLPESNAAAIDKTTIFVRGDALEEAERLRKDNFSWMDAAQIVQAEASDPGAEQDALLTVVLGADFPTQASPSPSPTSS